MMLENMDICMKKRLLNHTSHHAQNLRYATALNVKASTLNFLEEIQENIFLSFIWAKFSWNSRSSNHKRVKLICKLGLIKDENFRSSQIKFANEKANHRLGEIIYNHIPGSEFVFFNI